jgi:WD40 repeat protein
MSGHDDTRAGSALSPADTTRTRDPDSEVPGSPAADAPAAAVPAGDAGRYELLGEHGRGGLGRVSRAHDRMLGRDVAIKELISRGPINEVRFLREALITARLEHPGIVPIHEAGRWADGTPFYAMKLVAGRSLRDLLAERTTVDDRIALLHHVIAVADALAYAHGRRIIHRDLKPANVIVGDFGETVVIDWGLAKDLGETDEPAAIGGSPPSPGDGLTSAGAILGTPAYMAPEQERGEPVDQRADVFAIGAMLWELCSLQKQPPTSASQRRRELRRTGIDEDLIAIINQALDPDPARRYPDAGALAADLKAFKSGVRIAARRYSLPALLAHWTRRHRMVALSAAAVVALAAIGSILYVRNVAVERDRADQALDTAQQERDRAKLSQASLLLEKDPASARDVLAGLTLRSPQYALLMSRAQRRAATRVLAFPESVDGLFLAPGAGFAVLTRDGELHRIDPRTGTRQLLDRELEPAVIARAGGWLYARKSFGARSVSVSTPSSPRAFDTGALAGIRALASLGDAAYAIDSAHDLYRLTDRAPVLVRRGVHSIAGEGRLLVMCAEDGTLDVLRDEALVVRRRCPRIESPYSTAVVGDDYAAMTESGVLAVSRGGQTVDIPTQNTGEYELALSRTGVVALASYPRNAPWFVRPGEAHVEPGPPHASRLECVGAGGRFAAWGYGDGTVIATDTSTGAVWELKGHPDGVIHIAIDDAAEILVSASGQDVRVWDLRAPPVARVGALPCAAHHIQLSPDRTQAALDCRGGAVWLWTLASGALRQLHAHAGHAFGVQWLGDSVCSTGWDGKVLCSGPGGPTRLYDPGGGRLMYLAASPRHDALALAATDGKIWKLDDRLHELYAHAAIPFRLDISPDARRVASVGRDGSLIVFDLIQNRIVARALAHGAGATNVGWSGDLIWTAGIDGALRWWQLDGDALTLRSAVQQPAAVRRSKLSADLWVASIDGGVLLIGRTGEPHSVRLELGKRIETIDISPDLRHVAASIAGEIAIVDIRDRALATLDIDSGATGEVDFIDPTTLAVNAATALKLVHVDRLDYVRF